MQSIQWQFPKRENAINLVVYATLKHSIEISEDTEIIVFTSPSNVEAYFEKNKFGVNSMQYAIVENNKAMLYQTLGRYKEAIELMKDAIKNTEGTNKKLLQGKNSFDNRRFQSNLALLYQDQGDYPHAMPLLQRSLAMCSSRKARRTCR